MTSGGTGFARGVLAIIGRRLPSRCGTPQAPAQLAAASFDSFATSCHAIGLERDNVRQSSAQTIQQKPAAPRRTSVGLLAAATVHACAAQCGSMLCQREDSHAKDSVHDRARRSIDAGQRSDLNSNLNGGCCARARALEDAERFCQLAPASWSLRRPFLQGHRAYVRRKVRDQVLRTWCADTAA